MSEDKKKEVDVKEEEKAEEEEEKVEEKEEEVEEKEEKVEEEEDEVDEKAEADVKEADDKEEKGKEAKPGSETQMAIDDMDEGWPKSWIVTTAILGIVAIIIIARLVGAAKGKEGAVEHPGGPEAAHGAKHEPKQPEPKQHQPKHDPKKAAPAAAGSTVRLNVSKLSIPQGLYCVGTDKKLYKMNDLFARSDKCVVEMGKHGAYRVDFTTGNSEAEFDIKVLPPPDTQDAEFVLGSLVLPGGTEYWLGGAVHLPRQRGLIVALHNPAAKALTMTKVRLSTMGETKRPAGEAVLSVAVTAPSITAEGEFCVGTDKKLHAMIKEKAAPKVCALSVKDASRFRIELQRKKVVGAVRINLQAFNSRTNIVEGYLVPREHAEGPADIFEGSLRSPEDEAILLITTSSKEVSFKSLLFVAKK